MTPKILFPNENKEFIEDPYPYLKEIREQSPVVLDESSGLQLVTRFSGVRYTN